MKILKFVSFIAFTVLCSSVSYSAEENSTMKSILDAFYSSNPRGRALAKYCVGCNVVDSSKQGIPGYNPSKTDKPTFCDCDVENSYVYNVSGRVCQRCADTYVATVNAVDCQKIICPMGTYLAVVEKWTSPCPMGTYRQVLINKNETYVNPDNKTGSTTYIEQFK